MRAQSIPPCPDEHAAPKSGGPIDSSYRLLVRLPDLRESVAAGPLGRLRVNWRRRSTASDRARWRGVRLKWVAATAAALLLLAALVAVFSPSRPSPAPERASVADTKPAQPEQPSSAPAASVVPAGYQTTDSDEPKQHAPSLMALRPAKLNGSIETLDMEARR